MRIIPPESGRRQNKGQGQAPLEITGQVSIELMVALGMLVVLILGTTRIFVWLNQSLVERQKAYEDARTSSIPSMTNSFYTPAKLYVFPQEKPE